MPRSGILRPRAPIVVLLSAIGVGAIFAIALFLFHPYVPPDAVGQAFRFIADLQNGKIADADSLTDQGSGVGRDFHVFAANEDVVFLASSKPLTTLSSAHPEQSRAQRIHRVLRGRPADPAVLYLNFHVGVVPFLVRLRNTHPGWAVSYFEVHAE